MKKGYTKSQNQQFLQTYQGEVEGGQSHDEESQNNKNISQQQQPQYAEVEGRVIKLAGLDYNLLKQQKKKQMNQKQYFLENLKKKVNIISGNVLDRVNGQYKDNQNIEEKKINSKKGLSEKEKNLIKIISELQVYGQSHKNQQNTKMNKISQYQNEFILSKQNKKSEIFLQFQLDDFGRRMPNRLQKRLGKANNKSVYVHFDEEFLKEFNKSCKIKFNNNEKENIINAKKILNQMHIQNNEDDDIFGNDNSMDQDDDLNKNKAKDNKISIQIGKKLNFEIQQDIFGSVKRQKPIGTIEQQPQEKDKYFFMPKANKRNNLTELLQDDGYGQCYHQSGPSLQQLVDLKKQGIQYYGDLKQFKTKQRKAPNINKQYQMVKKIIQKKSKP